VAKRTRGTRVAAHKPGQRVAANRPPSARPTTPIDATAAVPNAAAGDLVIEDALATEALGPAGSSITTAPEIRRSTPGRTKVKPNSLLAARAETEYVYVGQDLRKIAIVGASLFGVMLLIWLLLVVVGIAGIY
jgi:hypothetical protein